MSRGPAVSADEVQRILALARSVTWTYPSSSGRPVPREALPEPLEPLVRRFVERVYRRNLDRMRDLLES